MKNTDNIYNIRSHIKNDDIIHLWHNIHLFISSLIIPELVFLYHFPPITNFYTNNPIKQIILLDGVNSHNIFNSTVTLLLRPQCYPTDFSEDIYHSFSYTFVLHQSLFAL